MCLPLSYNFTSFVWGRWFLYGVGEKTALREYMKNLKLFMDKQGFKDFCEKL